MQRDERPSETGVLVNTTSEFDYASVPTSVARFLKGQAARIRQYAGKTVVQIGGDLVSAKHYLSHGQFLRWVESEVGIPPRTAQAYMQAALWALDHRATAAVLPPSLLYILSSPSTPREFAAAVERRIEAGERISPTAVRAELKAIRTAERTKKVDARAIGFTTAPKSANHGDITSRISLALSEVVEILANSLPAADLSRICTILMSNEVLDQPDLAGEIRKAFCGVQPADSPTISDLRMAVQKRDRCAFDQDNERHHQHHNGAADPAQS
ncbi:DUF3102 domain-containing protein [Bradyrhizobium roseum]|uniref:DUF3102 domain-containing protein n=1 Tax=Bradyrhizobium roseum TaxID=3056648 RepID=UPI00260CF51E|nr:DUF3102 domain-containing protein [Bradyrhizobium roseus]WKA26407.1 hypothetical protein QUH67_22740 [Bradyrhizobium roseus]